MDANNLIYFLRSLICVLYIFGIDVILLLYKWHIYIKIFLQILKKLFFEITIFFVPCVCKSFYLYKNIVNILKLLLLHNNAFYQWFYDSYAKIIIFQNNSWTFLIKNFCVPYGCNSCINIFLRHSTHIYLSTVTTVFFSYLQGKRYNSFLFRK